MKKFQYITQNKLGSPISLSYGEQGKYSRAEESPGAVEKVLPQIAVKFVEAPLPGVRSTGTTEDRSAASCFIDYDNDGNIDLFWETAEMAVQRSFTISGKANLRMPQQSYLA